MRKAAWRLREAVKLGRIPAVEDYVRALAAKAGLPVPIVKTALGILERNKRLLASKNPWVWAALWLASFKKPGLLAKLAEAAGTTPASIRQAANGLKV